MSTNAEPISGAVPPDINKPLPPEEPTPPPPETPKEGIKVEVKQPDMLYVIAQNIVSGKDRFSKDISATQIGDSILSKEETSLSAFKATEENLIGMDGTYHFCSFLELSDERKGRSDHGYYNYEKARRIQGILAQRGVAATYDQKFGGRSVITINKDGQYVEVSFGLPNREAEEAEILREVEEDKKKKPGEPSYTEKYKLPEVKKGLVKDSIYLGLVDKTRAESGREAYPKLADEAEFSKAISTYAGVYKEVLKAIYAEEGVTPPDISIILRPPDLSADTLTQIKSVETPTPTMVTKEQLKVELGGFDGIAGQDTAVAEAQRLVLAINHPEVFEKRGVKRPKGILFYGPPGTGKTLIAKAVARESNADFLEVSTADIGTKWYGESERIMQQVFNIANKAVEGGRKVVIFFDELDALAPARAEAHEATKKVVATLLQNMDGMRANPNVTVIAASNRPQDIDPALKRPGRIDKLIPVGLPSAEGRSAILKVHMEKAKKTAKAPGELFSAEINLEQLGQITDGMSGADLANLVNLVLEDKVMAELEGQPWTPVSTEEMVSTAKRLGLLKEEKRRIGFDTTRPQNGKVVATNAVRK